MIISHTSPSYRKLNNASRWNGAYYYSKEIVKNIIPRVHTTYNWVTINTNECADHFGVSLSTVSKSVNEGREVAGLKFVRL